MGVKKHHSELKLRMNIVLLFAARTRLIMYRFIIERVSGDRPIRGRDDTVTRIYYQDPPPRTAVTSDNDDSGLSSSNLVYGNRGVTGVLQSTLYPRSATLTLLSKEAADKPVVHYEPRHTPPDSFEAQDFALRKAEILRQQAKRAKKTVKRTRRAKSPRRDSAVSEDDEPVSGTTVLAAKEQAPPLATLDPQEQSALPTIESQDVLTTTTPLLPPGEPQIIVTTTEPLTHRSDEIRESPKRQKLSPSPRMSSPAMPASNRPSKSRAGSEMRFAKPRTPPASAMATPAKRGESVVSVRSTDSRSSRRSRGVPIKDDLTIDSKFGMDAGELHEVEYLAKDGKWYEVTGGLGRPDWALDARPKVRVVTPSNRRSTGGWRKV